MQLNSRSWSSGQMGEWEWVGQEVVTAERCLPSALSPPFPPPLHDNCKSNASIIDVKKRAYKNDHLCGLIVRNDVDIDAAAAAASSSSSCIGVSSHTADTLFATNCGSRNKSLSQTWHNNIKNCTRLQLHQSCALFAASGAAAAE